MKSINSYRYLFATGGILAALCMMLVGLYRVLVASVVQTTLFEGATLTQINQRPNKLEQRSTEF